jgi:hypothetical protein
LFKEEFEAITAIDIIDEKDAFAPYELQFENNIGKEEFVDLGTPETIYNWSKANCTQSVVEPT